MIGCVEMRSRVFVHREVAFERAIFHVRSEVFEFEWSVSFARPIGVPKVVVVRVKLAVIGQTHRRDVIPDNVVIGIRGNAASGIRAGIDLVVVGQPGVIPNNRAIADAYIAQGLGHHTGVAAVNQAIAHDDAVGRPFQYASDDSSITHGHTFIEGEIPHDAILDARVSGAGKFAWLDVHGVGIAAIAMAISAVARVRAGLC